MFLFKQPPIPLNKKNQLYKLSSVLAVEYSTFSDAFSLSDTHTKISLHVLLINDFG